MIGITSYGAYVPRLRLNRKAIAKAMAWYNPSILGASKGEKAVANWDEDALTMAVAAVYDCVKGQDKQVIDGVYLASTSLPFADRLNADILATALNTKENGTMCADFTGSTKAATTATLSALDALAAGKKQSVLVAASDLRKTKMATNFEMFLGDGGAALLLGNKDVIAEYKDGYSLNCDFVDHYKGHDKEIDYTWEERWVRDEGYAKIIPQAIANYLARTGEKIGDFNKVVYPCYFGATHKSIAKRIGAEPERVQDNLHEVMGDTGCAHPILMLIAAIETAQPGDKLLLASFGQGCDVLSFEVTENIRAFTGPLGLKGMLAARVELDNYLKFIKFRDQLVADLGIRGEVNRNTSLTTLWRNRQQLIGLKGKRCTKCNTPQFTFTPICVNPECNATGSMEEYEFAGRNARVLMYTGDMLAPSADPPAIYGIVDFEGGGRLLVDFTDCTLEDVRVGLPVQLSFRRRYKDNERGFSGYFWKAMPAVKVEGV